MPKPKQPSTYNQLDIFKKNLKRKKEGAQNEQSEIIANNPNNKKIANRMDHSSKKLENTLNSEGEDILQNFLKKDFFKREKTQSK